MKKHLSSVQPARLSLRFFSVAALLASLVLYLQPRQAVRAATILYASAGGLTSGACDAWANACELRYALSIAVYETEIWVSGGTYKPTGGTDRSATFQLKNGVAIYGGFSGMEPNRDARDPAINQTNLSGDIGVTGDNSDNSYHVVVGNNTDATAILDGFTITGGNADGNSIPDNFGGGMVNENGSNPVLTNVAFSNNSAGWGGGGMYNENGSPILTGVALYNNYAMWGGGMYNKNSSPSLTGVELYDNYTSVTIECYSGKYGSVSCDSGFSAGGGMYNESSSPTLENVIFIGNTATVTCDLDFVNVNCYEYASLTYIAGIGGGMYNRNSSPALMNVTISGNVVSTDGGGMYNENSNPTLTNTTITANYAAGGLRSWNGGMYNDSSSQPTIINSILWGNIVDITVLIASQIYDGKGGIPTITYSDIQGGYPGTGNTDLDPLLGPVDYYDGSLVFPLEPGSAAIDAGDASHCPPVDLRGVPRPQGAHCDMGAFESRGFSLTVTSGDGQTTPVNTSFASPLELSVTSPYGEPVDGGMITFSPPSEGASAILSSKRVFIEGGSVSVEAVANGETGSYVIPANAAGVIAPVVFHLSNDPGNKYFIYLPQLMR